MGAIAAGGLENLKSRPIISSFAAITEPFMLIHMDCESLVRYAELGMPIACGSIPTSGANAPITPAGNALMGAAQIILIALLTQCVHPGLSVHMSVQPLMLDMMSTYTLQSNPETHLARMLANQVIEEGFNLPHHTTGGGTDSFVPGPESVANVSMTTLNTALSGATFLSNHGMCQTFKRFSPLQLIVDNEIISMVKAIKKGCPVDEETLDFEEILEVGERESFVDKEHNLRHFRDVYKAKIFNTVAKEQWEAAGSKDLFERAKDIYSDFKKNFQPRTMPEDIRKEMEKIVLRANQDLAGVRINMNSF
jgi:trimethylamine--corrinoid protein Co-methyltransferase